MTDALLLALFAGLGIAAMAGPLGCFAVWRRMAYFGDSLAHSALLGIALGLVWGFSANLGTIIICFSFAVLLVWMQQTRILATDTLLGILAHGSLSIGMVVMSFVHRDPEHHVGHAHGADGTGADDGHADLHAYLFGDIMQLGQNDLFWVYGGGLVVVLLLVKYWSPLLLMTLHEDLARAEGVKSFQVHLMLMFLMTIVVAVSIHIVGILLITSLLIIPAATARQLTRSPESMAIAASLLGMVSVAIGLAASSLYATPTGPSIVAAATGLFMLLFPASLLLGRHK